MFSKNKINLCLITKNRFFLKEKTLITNGFLFYQDIGILGFRLNEIEKLIFIGFNEEKEFDGYKYELNEIENVFIIGPKFREERRYILDRLINIFSTLFEIFKKRKILKDVDLVFASFFEYVVFEFLILKFICRKAKFINYIITDYPEWNYRKNKKLFFKYLLLFCLKIVQFLADINWALSNYLFEKYENKKSILMPSSSVRVNEIGKPKIFNFRNKIRILFVGRFAKEKRPEIALLVAKELANKGYNVELILVGDGELNKTLENMALSLKLENCKFLGWVKKRRSLMNIYEESDILLFTSTKGEGLGFVILEAMAKVLVILATKSGGPEELIEEGKNGFLFEVDDNNIINKLASKIEFLINHPKICEVISQNNIQKAKEWTIETLSKIQRKEILKLLNKYE
ncbi:MAG: glycosyltransferase [Candidatus Aenigmatarchaeota archaeon]